MDETTDLVSEGKERSERALEGKEKWRNKLAVATCVVALFGLISGNLAEHQAMDASLSATHAVDRWNQYGNKKNELKQESVFIELLRPQVGNGHVTQARIDDMEADITKHKKEVPELKAQAEELDVDSAHATKMMTYLHDAAMLFQLCIVLLSICMITPARWLVWKSGLGALIGAGLLAYTLWQMFLL